MVSLRTFTMTALIFMVVFAPFVHCFRPFPQEVKGGFPDEANQQERKVGNAESILGTEEDYARQIPTGPDPLHHNRHHPSSP